jgi:ATP-binding cassette subfamily B protein
LRDVTEGRTTIIVAHRLSTIRRADIIYVLDEGHVKEHGVHDDLIARDGIYAAIWRVQTARAKKERNSVSPGSSVFSLQSSRR